MKKLFLVLILILPLVLWAQDIPPLKLPEVSPDKPTPQVKTAKRVREYSALSLPDVSVEKQTPEPKIKSLDIPSLSLPDVPVDEIMPSRELRERLEIPPLGLPDVPVEKILISQEAKKTVSLPALSLPDMPPDEPQGLQEVGRLANIPTLTLPDMPYEPPALTDPVARELSSLELPTVSPDYEELRLSDFSGGLNKKDFPTQIADNEVTGLVNFVWEGKRLVPRDGFTTYTASEFAPGKRIWGLYPYYKQDGSKILLAGVNDTLYADTNSSGNFVVVKGGLQANNKHYYFDTFKDKAIVAHEGDYPFWYDGSQVKELGLIDSVWSYQNSYAGNCTTKIVLKGKHYDTDELVGYIIRLPVTAAFNVWAFIIKNEANNIWIYHPFVDGAGMVGIYGYFKTEILDDSLSPSSVNIDSCWIHIKYDGLDIANCCPLRIIKNLSTQQEAVVFKSYGGDSIVVHKSADFDISMVDQFSIVTKTFWKPQLVKIYKNRIFFADTNSVVFSNQNNLNSFDPDNHFTVKTDDGDHITALATFYDDQLGYKDQSKDCLIIFKQNSIYKLVWNSATDYALVQVVEGIGCVAPKTVVNIEGKYLLFLHTTGVYAFDGRTVTPVYLNIQPLIGGLTEDMATASAVYYDRHYYLSFPHHPFVTSWGTLLEDFEDTTGWSLGGVKDSWDLDDVNVREGVHSIQMTAGDTSVGGEAIISKYVNWDLSSMKNISFWIKVPEWDPCTTCISPFHSMRIVFSNDSSITDYFYKNILLNYGSLKWYIHSFKPGWNHFVIPRAVFKGSGSPSWSEPILRVQFKFNSRADSIATVNFDNLRMDYKGRAKCILTFDDGRPSVYTMAKPIMDANGQGGVAFIITNKIDTGDYMTMAQLEALRDGGWDISNHTITHPVLPEITSDSAEIEINGAYDWLVDNGFGATAKFFCYPTGAWNSAVVDIVKQRHKMGRPVIYSIANIDSPDEFIAQPHFYLRDDDIDHFIKLWGVGQERDADSVKHWIDNTIDAGGVMVMMFHKIVDYEPDTTYPEYNVDSFTIISNYLKERQADIDVITFSDYYDAVRGDGFVFNIDLGSWGELSNFKVGLFVQQTAIDDPAKLLFTSTENKSYIYTFGDTRTDTGVTVSVVLKSKTFDFNSTFRKNYIYFNMDYYLDDGDFSAYFYTDFDTHLGYNTIITESGHYRFERIPLDLDCVGRNFSFKLTSDNRFKLGSVALKFREIGE